MDFKGSERRIQTESKISGSINKSSDGVKSASRSGEKCSILGNSREIVTKGHSRGSEREGFSRFLQSPVFSTKTRSKMEDNFGSISVKQALHQSGTLQDGDDRHNSRRAGDRRMDDKSRFPRCIFPCTSVQKAQKIPEVFDSRKNPTVQSVTNGSGRFATSFYKNHQGHQGILAEDRNQSMSVSRRLAASFERSSDSGKSNRVTSEVMSTSRMDCEYEEIRVDPNTRTSILGLQDKFESVQGLSNRAKMAESAKMDRTIYKEKEDGSKKMVSSIRSSGINLKVGQAGTSTHESSTVRVENVLETGKRFYGQDSGSNSESEGGIEVVDISRECFGGGSSEETNSKDECVHRQFVKGLGRSSQPYVGNTVESTRCLVTEREDTTHKCTRDASSLESSGAIVTICSGERCVCGFGQHDSGLIHKEARRNKILRLARTNTEIVSVDGGTEDPITLSTYSRKIECVGGQIVQERRGIEHRVVPASSGSRISVEDLGETSHRFVCNQGEQEDGSICVPISGSTSIRGGFSGDIMERDDGICVSTDKDCSKGVKQSERRQVPSSSSSSSMATARMVCRVVKSVDRNSNRNSQTQKVVETASVGNLSSRSRKNEPSCVEVIRDRKRAEGFSEEVAKRMARPQKETSINVYEGKWKNFSSWCSKRGKDPYKATLPLVADFLYFKFEVEKREVETVKGYRTAISNVLKAVNPSLDVGKDSSISALISNLERDTSRIKRPLANWDLALVLQCLTKDPFEPLGEAALDKLTFKTIFLVTFAAGARRSEIHAAVKVKWKEDFTTVILCTNPKFLSKTQIVQGARTVGVPIVIKALSNIVGSEEDRLLCPVRALKFYLDRVKEFRNNKEKVFISYQKNHVGEVVKSTISSWIKKTVMCCYSSAQKDKEIQQLYRVGAHDLRRFSSSWAFEKNTAMEDIMAACQWKSHNTFTNFYLKDLTYIRDQLMELGPLSVTSTVVQVIWTLSLLQLVNELKKF